jgi:hypothetical protein
MHLCNPKKKQANDWQKGYAAAQHKLGSSPTNPFHTAMHDTPQIYYAIPSTPQSSEHASQQTSWAKFFGVPCWTKKYFLEPCPVSTGAATTASVDGKLSGGRQELPQSCSNPVIKSSTFNECVPGWHVNRRTWWRTKLPSAFSNPSWSGWFMQPGHCRHSRLETGLALSKT